MSILGRNIKPFAFLLFLIMVGSHLFILTRLIFFPYPELFIYPYLTNNGLVPYKQIFDQHFPGLIFLPVNLNNLGMTTPEVARLWLITIVLITQILIFLISWKLYKDIKRSLLACLLYLIWQPFLEGWVLWVDNFLPIFLLPAFYFTYSSLVGKGRSIKWYLALSGVFLGVAILFKQMAIPLSFLVFLLYLLHRLPLKQLFYYFLGLAPIPALMIVYFIWINDFKEFIYWTIIFNLTTFAQYGKKLPTFSGIVRVAGIYSPLIFFSALRNNKLTIILLVFIFGSLSGDIARFDFVHFQTSLPFIVILSSGVFFNLMEAKLLKWFLLAYVCMVCLWLVVFYKGHLSNNVMFFDSQTYTVADKIKQHTKAGEEIFILGPVPHLYQLSNTIPVGKIFVFQFPWFFRVTQDKFLSVLEANKPNLVVRDNSVVIEGDPITHYAANLETYINQNYTIIDREGSVEFLTKNI